MTDIDGNDYYVENDSRHAQETCWSIDKLAQASYKDLGTPQQVESRFLRHLLNSTQCIHDLQTLLHESSVVSRDYSIRLDAFDLIQNDPILGHMLLQFPQTLLPLLENAVVLAQSELLRRYLEGIDDVHNNANNGIEKSQPTVKGRKKGDIDKEDGSEVVALATTRVHARLVHLPPQCHKLSLGGLDASDVGKMWQVSGTVVRVGSVQMYESTRTYKCAGVASASSGGPNRWSSFQKRSNNNRPNSQNGNDSSKSKSKPDYCGGTFAVHADLELQNNALQQPERCPLRLPSNNSSASERCPGNKFERVPEGSVHTDYQEIKIQETSGSNLISDTIPRSLLIKLQHDLVDQCSPGDEVVIVGILLAQWPNSTIMPDMECQVGMAMNAHSICVVTDQGSSAWKQTSAKSGGDGNRSNSNRYSLGEVDQYRKDFQSYWDNPINIKNPILARDYICKAICPKLYGLQVIKLALLITMIGGVSSDAYENTQRNSDNHQSIIRDENVDPNDDSDEDCGPVAFQLTRDENANNNKRTKMASYYEDQSTLDDQQKTSGKRPNSSSNSAAVKTRRRDMSHLLLVGDPGTGKSQFLRFAAVLCPRSVLTTGVGTTSAGLTCAAVRESGSNGGNGKEFALEAGALVLADKGVCCIDEFGCIQKADRTTIHEAMEQQTLSIAKAGIVCKLNCRTTIIAVMNPIDCLYDNHTSLAVNTGLGTPLLSRFDLIFKLVDTSDAERDSNITTYLLNRAIQGVGYDVTAEANNNCDNNDQQEEGDNAVLNNQMNPWRIEKLRAYIMIVKERFQPSMTNEASTLLQRHYEKCRSTPSHTIPVTVRFLESLIRLCQAHARLMYRNEVLLQDAVAVIQVMECSAFAYGGFDGVDAIEWNDVLYRDPMTTDFTLEADIDFLCFEYRILQRYNMLSYIDPNRRNKAFAILQDTFGSTTGNTTTTTSTNNDTSWQEYEHAQVYQPSSSQHSHDGQQQNNSNRRSNDSNEQWTMPSQESATLAPTQDHYGRYHQNTPLTQNNKRQRK